MNNSNNNPFHSFSIILLNWYQKNKRELPWRTTTNPYKIWLSEVILQQTRVAQGLPYYLSFVENFPEVKDLASSTEEKILRVWQGLGYYSRAKNLHKCAQIITRDYNGVFPNRYKNLIKLPGIGSYTAAAIASICFNEPVAVVDGNVYRVLSRFYGIDIDISSSKGAKYFQELANKALNKEQPHNYNQAIMEFGALQCTPKNPQCTECPLTGNCYAYINNAQTKLPVKLKKTKILTRYFYYAVFEHKGKIALKLRDKKDIWQGLYDFPLYESRNREEVEVVINQLFKGKRQGVIENISREVKHVLSHQRIYGCFIKIILNDNGILLPENTAFYSKEEIQELPKPVLISNYLNETFF